MDFPEVEAVATPVGVDAEAARAVSRRVSQAIIDGKKVLQRMADETGGGLFEVGKKETFAEIYKQIGDELRAQYRLGYTPDKETASDGYHRIVLSLTQVQPQGPLPADPRRLLLRQLEEVHRAIALITVLLRVQLEMRKLVQSDVVEHFIVGQSGSF